MWYDRPVVKALATSNLPAPGTAFGVPLADGRFGLVRVLVIEEPDGVLIAVSTWIGTEAELAGATSDPRARQVLALTHHDWKGEEQRLWVSGPPPDNWRRLDDIPVGPGDDAPSSVHGNWESAEFHRLEQWRWENQRDVLMKEDRSKARARARAARLRHAKKKKETFAELARKRWCSSWDSPLASDAKKLILDLIGDMARLPQPIDLPQAFAKLRECVEALNRLHAENGNAFGAFHRDDLVEALVRIGLVAGLEDSAVESVVETARTW